MSVLSLIPGVSSVQLILGGVVLAAAAAGVVYYGSTRYDAGVDATTKDLTAKFGVEKKQWADHEAVEVSTAVAAYRDSVAEGNRRITALQQVITNDQQVQATLHAAYAGLAASHDSLQHAAAALADSIRSGGGAGAGNSATAVSSDATDDPGRVFAQLFSELDERAGILAKAADDSHQAGAVCVQSYGALSASTAASAASAAN